MSDITLGILGGGQLGSLLSVAANKLNIETVSLVMIKILQQKILQNILFLEIMMMKN